MADLKRRIQRELEKNASLVHDLNRCKADKLVLQNNFDHVISDISQAIGMKKGIFKPTIANIEHHLIKWVNYLENPDAKVVDAVTKI